MLICGAASNNLGSRSISYFCNRNGGEVDCVDLTVVVGVDQDNLICGRVHIGQVSNIQGVHFFTITVGGQASGAVGGVTLHLCILHRIGVVVKLDLAIVVVNGVGNRSVNGVVTGGVHAQNLVDLTVLEHDLDLLAQQVRVVCGQFGERDSIHTAGGFQITDSLVGITHGNSNGVAADTGQSAHINPSVVLVLEQGDLVTGSANNLVLDGDNGLQLAVLAGDDGGLVLHLIGVQGVPHHLGRVVTGPSGMQPR